MTKKYTGCRSCVLVFGELEPLGRARRGNGTDAFFVHFHLPKLAGFLGKFLLIASKKSGFLAAVTVEDALGEGSWGKILRAMAGKSNLPPLTSAVRPVQSWNLWGFVFFCVCFSLLAGLLLGWLRLSD